MFKKILIANRGEIACRIARTASRMNIKTVAVYSEADARALHVKMANEAFLIGPAASAQSYLRADNILDVCRQANVDAVHPGYGFLSENAAFAKALEEAGIAFIGPSVNAITVMGDKIESKRLAESAGVSTIPGYTDVVRDADHAVDIAASMGYPVMLKASAGGGGKGMRVASSDADCRDGFERATNEATSSFGDGRVFIEKFIEDPRHIEIQVLGDHHGEVVAIGERECSIQRRHQKVIEEAPSPYLEPETRAAMAEQACVLARAVEYTSAGTVEFIADQHQNFYFLEMNTRLQVEHPVTELVTGLDLVEWMIRVAAGDKLDVGDPMRDRHGWAIEARLYAEDPTREFLPSTGRLNRFSVPTDKDGVRLDTGVVEGSSVSMFYDPMIAKLITYGDTREQARARMVTALDGTLIEGVSHNADFLSSIIAHPKFISGELSTNLLAEEYPDGHKPEEIPGRALREFVVLAAYAHSVYGLQAHVEGWALDDSRREAWVVLVGNTEHTVSVSHGTKPNRGTVELQECRVAVVCEVLGRRVLDAELDGTPMVMRIKREGRGYLLNRGGYSARCLVLSPRVAELNRLMPVIAAPDTSGFLLSPMPGLLVSVSVKPGDEVKSGQELAVVEAMKMENVLRSDAQRVVARVVAAPGESLAVDQPIIEFE